MPHKHHIYDSDLHFIIDPITRKITSQSGKVSLMQFDHNSERFTFEIPRVIEGHDMSISDSVEVHYINTDSKNKREQSIDIYPVDDLQVSPDSNDVVIFSWLISQRATTYSGSLTFTIRFACNSEEGELRYQWFTDIFSVITIAKGIYNVDVATNNADTDLLAQWKKAILDNTLPYVKNIADEAITTLGEAKETLKEIGEKVTETEFVPNFETGNLEYTSPNYIFKVNTTTGNLEWEVIEDG